MCFPQKAQPGSDPLTMNRKSDSGRCESTQVHFPEVCPTFYQQQLEQL